MKLESKTFLMFAPLNRRHWTQQIIGYPWQQKTFFFLGTFFLKFWLLYATPYKSMKTFIVLSLFCSINL